MTAVVRRSFIVLVLLAALAAPQFALTAHGASEPAGHEHGDPVDGSAIETGLRRGDQGPEVQALQEYLEMAGFLSDEQAADATFDEATESALRRYQRHHRMQDTGTVTPETAELFHTPRFDTMPDVEGEDGGRSLAYVTGNKWTKTNLTYAFKKYTPDLDQNAQKAAIRQAFDTWMAVTPLVITEISSTASADIVISFESGSHGDPCSPASSCAFDGPSGTLAHAFYPPPNGGSIAGDTHFDEAEKWTLAIPVPGGGIDLKSVAIHEFGHALGLGHSSVAGAIMYPYYSGIDHDLHSDDIAGIQSLYGANPGGGGGAQTIDASVVSVTMSPSSTTVGGNVNGTVQVRNNGTQATAIPVTVSGPGGFSVSKTSATVNAGQSANVTFSWTASTAGSFTFTATANLSGDSNAGNNSKTSNTVTVSNPPQQTVDAAVVSAAASPTSITRGSGNVTITASVRNNGSASASVPVSISGPNGWSASTTRSLAAGASATVQFGWPASVSGTHSFTVTTSLTGDQQASNNSKTTNSVTVTDPAPAGNSIYFTGVAVTATPSGSGHALTATVSVGPNASAANGAYMYGFWIFPNGLQQFAYGYANGTGKVTLQTTTTQTGAHKFQASRLMQTGYVYNAALNTGDLAEVNVGGGTPPPPVVIDASVNQVTASPASLQLNSGNVTITATIGNNGSNTASIPVTLSGPNGHSEARNVSVAAGASVQTSFTWPASVAGNHTFTVTTSLAGDSNASNNQRASSTVNVTEPPTQTIDAEIVSLTRSTSSVQQNGSPVTLTANVRNNGSSSATFNVRLASPTASINQAKSVTLAAGASGSVQFQWSPTISGNHTFTATSELSGDANAANNSKSTSINVTAPAPPSGATVYVERIYIVKNTGRWYVYVFLGSNQGAVGSGATISATVRAQSGQTAQHSGTTYAGGYAILMVDPVGSGKHTLTVNDVTLSGYSYNAALDKGNPAALP